MAAVPFESTLRALDADSVTLKTGGIVLGGLVLSAWLLWFVKGRVGLYEVSREASLEALLAAHPVATKISGRVLSSHLELGRHVNPGDLLVELDAEAERLELQRNAAKIIALEKQIAALRPEIAANKKALAAYHDAVNLTLAESRAEIEAKIADSQFADAQLAAREKLLKTEVLSLEAFKEAEAKAKVGHASVKAHAASAGRIQHEGKAVTNERNAQIAQLERKLAELEGQVVTETTESDSIRQRIASHSIRAAIGGQLGRVEPLRVGAVVQTGQVFGSIIPAGELHAVAWFPSSAVGRIHAGQAARLRLDGFPWVEFGTVAAKVSSVGSDPLAGKVKVEMAIDAKSAPNIPLGHGLTGSAEVEVGRVVPAKMLMNTVGRWLTARQSDTGK